MTLTKTQRRLVLLVGLPRCNLYLLVFICNSIKIQLIFTITVNHIVDETYEINSEKRTNPVLSEPMMGREKCK